MQIKKTEVLVIGAGAAGLRAALGAATTGARVTVLRKSAACCTIESDRTFEIPGGGGCGVASPIGPSDSSEAYFTDLMKVAAGCNKPELTRLFAEKSVPRCQELTELGVEFERDENHQPRLFQEIWHSHPRILYSKRGTGHEIHRVMLSAVERLGVEIKSGWSAIRLFRDASGITGCLAQCFR